MSSVSPTDGGYQYYRQTLQELEDELNAQAQKHKKNQDEQVQELDNNYQTELRKKDAEMDRTVQNLRNNLEETLTRAKTENHDEIARIKNETYDKYGRYQGNEADVLKQQFKSAEQGWTDIHKNDKKLLEDSESVYTKHSEDVNQKHQLDLEKALSTQRDSFNEIYSQDLQEKKSAFDGYLGDVQKQYQNLVDDQMKQANYNRRETNHSVDELKKDHEKQLTKLKDTDDLRADDRQKAFSDTIQLIVNKAKDGARVDNQILRDQISSYLDNESHIKHEKANVTQQAISDYERDWLRREKSIKEGYEDEIADLKRKLNETEEVSIQKKNEALKEKDSHFTNLVLKQNLENHTARKDLTNAFQQNYNQLQNQLVQERDRSDITNEKTIKEMKDDRENALKEQAKAYNDTLSQVHEASSDKIKLLEQELNYRKNTGDTSAIPPAAEANLRQSIVKEYEKTFQAERNSNEAALDRIQRESSQRLYDLHSENQSKENSLSQQHASQTQEDRANFMHHLQDLEFLKENTLKNKEDEHNRETDNLNNNYASVLNKQKKQYEELLELTKAELGAKAQEIRLDKDFQMRMAQREYAAKQNEMIREYEKKFTDQKSDYEAMIDSIKEDGNKSIRDQDRAHRREVDDLTKAYEQKLAQQEQQMKERERVTTQNHEQELDNMRRAHNALLQRRNV